MATELLKIEGTKSVGHRTEPPRKEPMALYVTAFWGGRDRGRCVQITVEHEYIELTYTQVKLLAESLGYWLESKRYDEKGAQES